MTKRVSAANAKANLSALVAEVAFGGQHIVIERRGKPLAAIVKVSELERLEPGQATAPNPRGALSLTGIWKDIPEKKLDALVKTIYKARTKDTGRPIILEV